MSKRSAEHLKTLVQERHSEVRQNLDALVTALATNDKAQVQNANQTLRKSLHALGAVIAREDWPGWLSVLVQRVDHYETHHDNGVATWKKHLLSLIERYSEAVNHQWFTGEEEGAADFDLDSMIENARNAHKIDDLFGQLITVLERLAQCDELDSVKACDDLARIISILRRAKAGSFMSQVATWAFARRFLPNLFKEYVKQSKAVGPILKAFDKTAQDLDIAFNGTQAEVGRKFLEVTTSGFRSNAIRQIDAEQIRALPDLSGNSGKAVTK